MQKLSISQPKMTIHWVLLPLEQNTSRTTERYCADKKRFSYGIVLYKQQYLLQFGSTQIAWFTLSKASFNFLLLITRVAQQTKQFTPDTLLEGVGEAFRTTRNKIWPVSFILFGRFQCILCFVS